MPVPSACHERTRCTYCAYCAQTAWILNATVKENIVFGEAFNAARYAAVLRSC